jgi:hypothetical protein
MKIQLTIITALIYCLILSSCKNDSKLKKENKHLQKTEIKTIIKTEKKVVIDTLNFELLQGKWQSDEDKTNFLVFDKNHRKEIAKGSDGWDDEEFILSDRCMNKGNSADNEPREKDNYISCKESDLCWYILSVSSKKLTLQYMGRGNTLIYTRVKK